MGLSGIHEAAGADAGPVQAAAAGTVSWVGRTVSWLLPVMVALVFAIVLMRYGFNLGWIWLQELVVYMHSAVFLLAIAWAFQGDEHVRVDIFYRDTSPRHKARINLGGTLLFVVPFSVYLLWVGWEYVSASWAVHEGSREAGGLNFVYLLKSLIVLLPVLLLMQCYDTIRHCLQTLRANRPGSD